MGTTGWFNKRPEGAFALTATDAFWWHAACPCNPSTRNWRQIQGRGEEGAWATAWLDWLWRTHLEPRGFVLVEKSGHRILDIRMSDEGALARLREAVTAGPVVVEPEPIPPFAAG
jgi:hypothetical protein